MIRFDCDYLEGAHPSILQRLQETNLDQTLGYGTDPYCAAAADKIRAACGLPGAGVHFMVGGTQTNTTVIYSLLRPWEGVFSVDTGHINCHESGAIEGTGHKVLAIPGENGKLTARRLEEAYRVWDDDTFHEHIVKPGMVYLSQPTETGSLYHRAELEAIYAVCQKYHLPLYIDGARLAYALAAEDNDLTLPELAHLCDVFYIGGTKVGALFGEALVIPEPALIPDIRPLIKQRGGLLAKGRLLGIQFDTLFTDDLYFKIARNAIDMAFQIRDIFVSNGYPLLFDSPTNQQYPIIPDEELAILGKEFGYEYWTRVDETHSGVRFCGSWATKQENVDALRAAVNALKGKR